MILICPIICLLVATNAALIRSFCVSETFVGPQLSHTRRGHERRKHYHSSAKCLAAGLLSWHDLERECLSSLHSSSLPVNIDSVYTPEQPVFSSENPTLFRERHGWCPYSERVWLALETAGCDYDTVRIDNTGHGPQPSYWSGTTPQVRWPERNNNQGESMDLVYQVDARYCDGTLKSNDAAVRDCIAQFQTIFPRARPSSRAAYLFQYNGEPLWKSTFETTLRATNDLLEKSTGPFLCGATFTAADVAWAPFLERYRYQLPALHEGLRFDTADANDTNSMDDSYPALQKWYQAVDRIPAYACRVAGNASSWRKVLTMAGFGNAGAVPPQIQGHIQALVESEKASIIRSGTAVNNNLAADLQLWNEYLQTGSRALYMADTPASEAAHVIIRNRAAIARDVVQRARSSDLSPHMPDTEEGIDAALRQLARVLLQLDHRGNNNTALLPTLQRLDVVADGVVGAMATFLDERMCVPRDMGAMSAARIAQVAVLLSK